NLYFFADMDDGDLFADIKEHDGNTWHNDVFELFFKPAEGKNGYYEFQVNAANTQFDMFMPDRGKGDFEQAGRQGPTLVGGRGHPLEEPAPDRWPAGGGRSLAIHALPL